MNASSKHRSPGAALLAPFRLLAGLIRNRRGNVGATTALLIVPLVAVLGMATEATSWFLAQRAMQNASDSAALAAATNGDAASKGTTYISEAKSVAAKYGFTDGVNNTTVAVSYTTFPSIPQCSKTACYSVVIARSLPLYLSPVVGFSGNATLGPHGHGVHVAAGAVATPSAPGGTACILVLEPAATTTTIATGLDTTLTNCSLQVNSDGAPAFIMSGGTITAQAVNVVGNLINTGGTINGRVNTSAPAQPDPYAGVYAANDVSATTSQNCLSTTPTIIVNGTSRTLSPGFYCHGIIVNSGGLTFLSSNSGNYVIKGGITINNGTVTFGSGIYVLQGGIFQINQGTVTGSDVTFILTCGTPPCSGSSPSWATTTLNGGTVNLSAPTTGEWNGILFYQDPTDSNYVGQDSLTGTANSLQGALYFPDQNVIYTGSLAQCTQLVVWQLTLTGGTTNSNCAGTGVQPIGSSAAVALVH